jgi:hypothetical protein
MTDKTTMTAETFSVSDVDRVLGIADQFLEEWAEDAVQSGERDPKYEERSAEWKALRPLLVASPALLRGMLAIREAKLRRVPLDLASCAVIAEAAIAAINDAELQERIRGSHPHD